MERGMAIACQSWRRMVSSIEAAHLPRCLHAFARSTPSGLTPTPKMATTVREAKGSDSGEIPGKFWCPDGDVCDRMATWASSLARQSSVQVCLASFLAGRERHLARSSHKIRTDAIITPRVARPAFRNPALAFRLWAQPSSGGTPVRQGVRVPTHPAPMGILLPRARHQASAGILLCCLLQWQSC